MGRGDTKFAGQMRPAVDAFLCGNHRYWRRFETTWDLLIHSYRPILPCDHAMRLASPFSCLLMVF